MFMDTERFLYKLYNNITLVIPMAMEVVIKKWGNSLGAIFPKSEIEKGHLRANDKIIVEVVKKADLRDIFGTLKRKMSGQEFKDMVKEGWEK